MRVKLALGLLVGLLAGCAADDPASSSAAAARPAQPAQPARTGVALGSLRAADFAALPDRGSLLAYDRQSIRQGASTWYPVKLSEAHALHAIGGTLALTAPDGSPIRLRYARHVEHRNGNWTWVGRVDGSGAEAIITFGEKAAFGSIPSASGDLRLTTAGGRAWLVSTDPRLAAQTPLPSQDDAIELASVRPRDGLRTTATLIGPKAAAAVAAASATTAQAATPSASAQSTVDVLMGYTTGFATRLGGQSQALTRLTYIVDVANQALANSQLGGRLRLVQALEVNYADNTSNRSALFDLSGLSCHAATGATLPQLPGHAGGVACTSVGVSAGLQPLIAARETSGADVVSLVRVFTSPDNTSCGVAWMLGAAQTPINASSAPYALSVISDSSGNQFPSNGATCRDETFAHEVGHTLGLQHDRADAAGTDDTNGDTNVLDPEEYGRYAYAFGYNADSSNGNFTDVMGIRKAGQASYRVYSNPRVTICGGHACGVANEADSALALSQTMPVVAAFRTPRTQTGSVWYRGDFDADGHSDLFWRNLATGANAIWRSADSHLPLAVRANATLSWLVMGAGDFDGDGHSDLLWRNIGTGANVVWKSGNATTPLAVRAVTDQSWIVVGAGDFDGDGKSDILWRNASNGLNAIWKSANATTPQAITSVDNLDWRVAGVGDFDGDNRDDILWRNDTTGADIIWKGGSAASTQAVSAVSTDWIVAGVGDFDGDGKADILWRNTTTGGNVYWKSGNSLTRVTVTTVPNLDWMVAATGDFDGDGKADILWRNAVTGANVMWKSANSSTAQAVTGQANFAWSIVG